MEFDVVPPPAAWQVEEEQVESFTHLNIRVIEVELSENAHGLLGVSKTLKYTEAGEPVRACCE